MSAFLALPVAAAYHLACALVLLLAPLGGGAAPAAIVLFTMAVRLLLLPLSYRALRGIEAQARIAPAVRSLRERYSAQPGRLREELAALYHGEGISAVSGCLPALLQWPVLTVMYLLFRSPTISGAANSLLGRQIFGVPLGSHWLAAGGPFSPHGAVFAGLFLLLAAVGWLSGRMARPAATAAGSQDAAPGRRLAAALSQLAPFGTVAVAAFLPLAAGLYLLTSSAWSLAERAVLRRNASRP
jgi:YidC/Oxa1 family membrane protein insertase